MAEKIFVMAEDGKFRAIGVPAGANVSLSIDQYGEIQLARPVVADDGTFFINDAGEAFYF